MPDAPEETPTPESDFVEPTTPYGTPPELLESIDNSSELREKKKNNAEPIALVASILAFFFAGLSLYAFIAMGASNAKNSKLITNFQNDLKHTEGVLSMARTMAPDSAGSQFFIMHKDAPHLDGEYAAFGKITEGMDVVDKIANVETDFSDRPRVPQVMKSVTVETFGVDYPMPETMQA